MVKITLKKINQGNNEMLLFIYNGQGSYIDNVSFINLNRLEGSEKKQYAKLNEKYSG